MKVNDIKHLEKIIKMCRRNGVDIIKLDGVEFHLGTLPAQPVKAVKTKTTTEIPTFAPGGITADTPIDMPDELTEEQLLFYSATDRDFSSSQQ